MLSRVFSSLIKAKATLFSFVRRVGLVSKLKFYKSLLPGAAAAHVGAVYGAAGSWALTKAGTGGSNGDLPCTRLP